MEYLPIRTNTLRPDADVNFDIFIQVGERYVHYIKNSDPMEASRLSKLKEKKVRKLYILSECEKDYLHYLDQGLQSLTDQSKNIEERGALAHDSMVTAAENAERSLETEQGFKRSQDQFEKVIDFLMSDQGAMKQILNASGYALDNHHHAATVSTLSLSLAAAAELKDSKELFELGIAALVHDIGKNNLPFDAMKLRDEMTPEERKRYECHPADGANMLAGKPFISGRILGLISDHEEIGRGRGFPEKKDISKLKKPYQILNVCNDFDRFCFEKKMDPLKAIDPFYEARGENFSEELITLLATILN